MPLWTYEPDCFMCVLQIHWDARKKLSPKVNTFVLSLSVEGCSLGWFEDPTKPSEPQLLVSTLPHSTLGVSVGVQGGPSGAVPGNHLLTLLVAQLPLTIQPIRRLNTVVEWFREHGLDKLCHPNLCS